jgi:hypothetical protein
MMLTAPFLTLVLAYAVLDDLSGTREIQGIDHARRDRDSDCELDTKERGPACVIAITRGRRTEGRW